VFYHKKVLLLIGPHLCLQGVSATITGTEENIQVVKDIHARGSLHSGENYIFIVYNGKKSFVIYFDYLIFINHS
jgi:hypothetical protein